jgi:hypothetical protein
MTNQALEAALSYFRTWINCRVQTGFLTLLRSVTQEAKEARAIAGDNYHDRRDVNVISAPANQYVLCIQDTYSSQSVFDKNTYKTQLLYLVCI